MTSSRISRIATLAFLTGVASCKIGVGGTTGPQASGHIVRVVVTPSSATIGVGETLQLTAAAYDGSGTVVTGASYSWTTGNGSVATFTSGGSTLAMVTGDAVGSAQISATADGQTGSSAVTVENQTFASVSVGVTFVCALTSSGAAYCWGDNNFGQLGLGAADTVAHPKPARVAGGLAFTALAAGGAAHACGLVAGGAMYCWGDNSLGQLGIGSVDLLPHPVPALVTGSHAFTSFVVNGPYTCAVDSGGAAWCWGDGTYGELGSASLQSSAPSAVGGGLAFTGITGGNFHVCAATSAGAAYCWGRNNAGQLGIGSADTLPHTAPAAVVGGILFSTEAGGANYTCGISGTHGYCWGSNAQGVLGTGLPGRDSVPTPIAGGIAWKQISGSHQTCAVSTINVAYCWGDNSFGELGIGSMDTLPHGTPVPVAGGLTFNMISVNRNLTSCGVTTSGRLYCWGDNARGELGNGTTAPSATPTVVSHP